MTLVIASLTFPPGFGQFFAGLVCTIIISLSLSLSSVYAVFAYVSMHVHVFISVHFDG